MTDSSNHSNDSYIMSYSNIFPDTNDDTFFGETKPIYGTTHFYRVTFPMLQHLSVLGKEIGFFLKNTDINQFKSVNTPREDSRTQMVNGVNYNDIFERLYNNKAFMGILEKKKIITLSFTLSTADTEGKKTITATVVDSENEKAIDGDNINKMKVIFKLKYKSKLVSIMPMFLVKVKSKIKGLIDTQYVDELTYDVPNQYIPYFYRIPGSHVLKTFSSRSERRQLSKLSKSQSKNEEHSHKRQKTSPKGGKSKKKKTHTRTKTHKRKTRI